MSSINVLVNGKVKEARWFVGQPDWPDLDLSPDSGRRETSENSPSDPVSETGFTAMREKQEVTGERLAAEREEAFRRGFAEGKREGLEEGRRQAEKELSPQLELVRNLIAALKEEKESFYHENEVYIVKLAIEIARKILNRELSQNPELMLYIVREALRKVAGKGRIIIHLNPADLALVKDKKSQLGAMLSAFEQVDFLASDDVQRYGCVIESDSGIVDAQLDVQLEQIERSLLEGSGD